MTVEWVELRDYRCHPVLAFTPESGVNVLLGSNGAGKTSVLEAIEYASSLRSFRRTPDAALVRSGAKEAIVRTGVSSPGGQRTIEISVPLEGRRRVLLNGKRPGTNAELRESLRLVAFLPDDLELVKGGPSRRRDFLDQLAAQLSPEAAAVQAEYARALRQRNTLLRQEGRAADPVTLAVWDERLSAAGAAVTGHRLAAVEQLTGPVRAAHASVAGIATVSSEYRSAWVHPGREEELAEALREALTARHRRDMEVRSTSVGPHRDEPLFLLDGRPSRTQASQGEQRSLALALRLASYHLIAERFGEPPVLLLDDVFSELDEARSKGVMEILPRGQVFVTSAREDEVPVAGRRWDVKPGSIT